MKIDQCQDPTLLSALLDGELAPEQSVAVHSHLKTCEACQRQLDILRKSDAMVQTMAPLTPSADFDNIFWAKIAAQPERKTAGAWLRVLWTGWRSAIVAGLAAAAAMVIIFVTINVHRGPTPEEVFIAQNMELLKGFDIIGQLDMLQLDAMEIMREPF